MYITINNNNSISNNIFGVLRRNLMICDVFGGRDLFSRAGASPGDSFGRFC